MIRLLVVVLVVVMCFGTSCLGLEDSPSENAPSIVKEMPRELQTTPCDDLDKKSCSRKKKTDQCRWDKKQTTCYRAKSAFFVGNSFTVYNGLKPRSNMPTLVSRLSKAGAKSIEIKSRTKGGATIQRHAREGWPAKLGKRHWSWIVLQEQSQILTFGESFWDGFTQPYAQEFQDMAVANGGTLLLYETWGYKDGDRGNFGGSDTYFKMQDRLHSGYSLLAQRIGASVCEVGQVWKKAVQYLEANNGGDISKLYATDGRHPSHFGHWLVACSFYACIHGESPVGIKYRGPKVSEEDDALVKQWVEEVLLP